MPTHRWLGHLSGRPAERGPPRRASGLRDGSQSLIDTIPGNTFRAYHAETLALEIGRPDRGAIASWSPAKAST